MGTLYLVATPIGNMSDISYRAVETLKSVDFIAAEDTRVTVKLLNRFEIKKPMVSYYEHNRAASGEKIIERLLNGENCALVSDAGTPIISDPGFDLVALCSERGIAVETIPGPCAAIAAITLSALPSGRFTFEGFLAMNRRTRREHLEDIKYEKRTMVFYEAPHKLLSTLKDLLDTLGDRRVSVSREITKLHQETLHTTLTGAVEHFTVTLPRGEFVLVVEGASESEEEQITFEAALQMVEELIASGNSLKDASKSVAEKTEFSRKELYDAIAKNK